MPKKSRYLLVFKVTGTLTHDDYEMINPMLDKALEGVKHPNINVFIDLSKFDGWELRAAWDDLKIDIVCVYKLVVCI